ncbi:EamA family transporter [Mycetocola tolaasinivorans]|uniref:EamA family transporter n=1 Tax=Mycetocola tolaasinivorans TaxID=76635 RepID=A0A3L7A7B0_9MICO|nr:EamA family transporter [Mycetocola tolaasinivorans]RLP76057.1 EamA family transporter [Mycetocola tolaasinivorans]
METNLRWILVTAIAPILWGATYYVTAHLLPADSPLWGSVIRALPAGLILLAIRRTLPRGSWWWRALVLGTVNMGAFFALVYVAAQLLPTSIASTIMATGPIFMMLVAWALIKEKPRAIALAGAILGLAGVAIMLGGGGGEINTLGVLASVTAMLLTAVGFVLAKRWAGQVDPLSLTSWQLLAAALVLIPAAIIVEGAPPALDGGMLLGFGYVSILATALAYTAWFTGLKHLSAGSVGLIGLLNPVVGVLLGTLLAGESLGLQQILGLVLILAGILLGQPIFASRRSLTARVS